MHVLIAHSRYQQPGGEETVVEQEAALLESLGHKVIRFERDNEEVADLSKPRLAVETIHSRRSARELASLVKRHSIDIVHVHNTLPLLSPSVYRAADRAGAAVVQTVHNFRLMCANGLLLREGRVCTDCVGRKLGLPGVRHACYRGSRAASCGVVASTALARATRAYTHVHRWIALTGVARKLLIQQGLPGDRVVVRSNMLERPPEPGLGERSGCVFVGRLSDEKGVLDLVDAWKQQATHREESLTIVGSGPLESKVRDSSMSTPSIRLTGFETRSHVSNRLQTARALVIPSRCIENVPMTLLEALASGTPVLAPEHTSFAPILRDDPSSLIYSSADPAALARAISDCLTWSAAELNARSTSARALFDRRFVSASAGESLTAIYDAAIRERRAR